MLKTMFVDHCEEVGETYTEHFAMAAGFGSAMILGGIACMLHAIVPGICKTTGSETVRRLYGRMVEQRNVKRAQVSEQRNSSQAA